MPKPRARSRILKKLPGAFGSRRPPEGTSLRHDRNLVRRRGPHRPEEQDHPPLGQARHPPQRASRPAYCLHLHLRCGLPEGGQGRSPDLARLQHRGDELAPGGNRSGRCARRPRHPLGRPSWLAYVDTPRRPGQHHHHSAAAKNAPSLTRSKTSGSSCGKTGSQTACSNHTTISSTIAARPGTGSSISPGASCP